MVSKLEALITEWNAAESAIKQAGGINADLLVPALSELRYAGRSLVEGLKTSSESERDDYYDKARYYCNRSRHDTIDARALYLIAEGTRSREIYDPSVRATVDELNATLNEISSLLAASRQDTQIRDTVYNRVELLLTAAQTILLQLPTNSANKRLNRVWIMLFQLVLGFISALAASILFSMVAPGPSILRHLIGR